MAIWRLPIRITDQSLPDPGFNIFHVRTADGPFPEAELNQASGWLEDFYSAMVPVFSSNTDIQFDGTVTEINSDTPRVGEGLTTWKVDGTSTSLPLPPANCVVVGWRTTLATRSGRGRTFLGPIAANASEADGTVTATALSTIRGAAAALVDESTASEVLGVVSLGIWSPTRNELRDITGTVTHDRFAVLRSRRD